MIKNNNQINNNMKKTIKTAAVIAMVALSLSACKKDSKEPTPENPVQPTNESELITTMKVTLHDTTTNTNTTYVFSDLDGPGGNPASFGGTNQSDSVINITANHVYKCTILLLNQTKTPADTISNEVISEGADHMIFFNSIAPSGTPYNTYLSGSATYIKYLDLDANNRGIGLSTLWTAPSTAKPKAELKIELKHQPGVKDGSYAPGETDTQVNFKLIVN